MTTEGVRGLAEVISEAAHKWNRDALVTGRTDVEAVLATAALAWFDARLGSGEVVEAALTAHAFHFGMAACCCGHTFDESPDLLKGHRAHAAAAAIEAVRAALKEGE